MNYEELFEKVTKYAEGSDKVRAMVLFGSRVRSVRKADSYSDYDLILFVTDVDYFIHGNEWLDSIAKPFISFVEPTAVQDFERRLFFENAMDMDFIFYDASKAAEITGDDIIKSWYSRGYKIIVDKMGYADMVNANAAPAKAKKMLELDDFTNLVNVFWFHTIWAAKKLLRGETWSAKSCIDGHLKTLFREVLELREKARCGAAFDAWHDGRFFDQWVDAETVSELDLAYGAYNKESLTEALLNTMRIFSEKAKETAKLYCFPYPLEAEEYAERQVKRLLVR